jgi:hypothetical protein
MVMNKKGMMDDLFDFIFTITSLFFLLFFVALFFSGNISNSHETSTSNIADFKITDTAINNLQRQAYIGEVDSSKIDSYILGSNAWNGKIITSCYDYIIEPDCEQDPMGKGIGLCTWTGDYCYYATPGMMLG